MRLMAPRPREVLPIKQGLSGWVDVLTGVPPHPVFGCSPDGRVRPPVDVAQRQKTARPLVKHCNFHKPREMRRVSQIINIGMRKVEYALYRDERLALRLRGDALALLVGLRTQDPLHSPEGER